MEDFLHRRIDFVNLMEASPLDTCYLYGLTLIPAWIINYIHYKVYYEIIYPFPNFNGATTEVSAAIILPM